MTDTGETPRQIIRETLVTVENPEQIDGLLFDASGYSEFLGDVGFGNADINNVTMTFRSRSALLRNQVNAGMNVQRVQAGSYHQDDEGKHVITVFVEDTALAAKRTGQDLSELLNETAAHETGHLFDAVVRGASPISHYKQLLYSLGRVSTYLRNLPFAMGNINTVQELLPLYSDKPLLVGAVALGSIQIGNVLQTGVCELERRRYRKSPAEAFARAFREGFQVPDFISIVDSTTA